MAYPICRQTTLGSKSLVVLLNTADVSISILPSRIRSRARVESHLEDQSDEMIMK